MKTGKIIKGIAGFYYVHDGHNQVYECKAKGIFRNRNLKPMVGDYVALEVLSEEEGLGNITEIFPRKNSLIRPACANVDQALVIFAVKEPEPNLNLLDRFLVMMEFQEVPCQICFNKMDLGTACGTRLAALYEKAGYPVHLVSTYTEEGLFKVQELIQGKTTVMAGPSGVGKSSVMNLIYPEAAMETGQISEKLKRGRHTTRHTELFCVGEDTFLLDTPGFSSLELEQISCGELRFYYPEFLPFEGGCRFQGCVHGKEPGCAVKEALEKGVIGKERYENYLVLYEELKTRKRYGR
ncbi:MAG: ribosome small subunit-dependent GTPase A [Lachnospiraceae bacterium]|nr:ribosome small subunit-dependent GTPase A [Lachnospiraceae bacterium]